MSGVAMSGVAWTPTNQADYLLWRSLHFPTLNRGRINELYPLVGHFSPLQH